MSKSAATISIQNTELYSLFAKKAEGDLHFIAAVTKVCEAAIELSKTIIEFFKTFTLHDVAHLTAVCDWMYKLLGKKAKELSKETLALLLMSACCHDIGMAVSKEQKKQLLKDAAENTPEWKEYFKSHPADKAELNKGGDAADAVLRNFVRINHHKRVKQQIGEIKEKITWSHELTQAGLDDMLIEVCQSHGEDIKRFDGAADETVDLPLCAVLLRLADALDYDSRRAPEILFHFLGLDDLEDAEKKKSTEEWIKNRTGKFNYSFQTKKLSYTGETTDQNIDREICKYIDWLEADLEACREYLSKKSPDWEQIVPKRAINKDYFKPNGFLRGDFSLKMDKNKVLELLSGEDLYNEAGVFVRELLQNAIDAVLMRAKYDEHFDESDGLITVTVWEDGDGYWFRIQDNGVGMDKRILQDYFLTVGRSYYTDERGLAAEPLPRGNGSVSFGATSRFGIGILSCFMNSPGNTLEVATKRYSNDYENKNPVYRLDVTGLHGQYYLTELSDTVRGRPMHNKGGEESAFYHGVGTTVCVRLNMNSIGMFSFKELMDKYVCYPRVKVKYSGSECEDFEYKTQAELMELVHKLNPDFDGINPTEHKAPLPDAAFNELKSKMPFIDWDVVERPNIMLKFYPLDLMAPIDPETGVSDLSGVIVKAELEAHLPEIRLSMGGYDRIAETSDSCVFDPVSLAFETEISLVLDRGGELCSTYGIKKEYAGQPMKSCGILQFNSLEKLNFSKNNDAIFNVLRESAAHYGDVAAYNGATAEIKIWDNDDRYNRRSSYIAVLLLNGKYRPQVSMARSQIKALPLEAACCLELICNLLRIDTSFNSADFSRLPARELYLALDRQKPELIQQQRVRVRFRSAQDKNVTLTACELEQRLTKGETQVSFGNKWSVNSWYNYEMYVLILAELKRRFTVELGLGSGWFVISQTASDGDKYAEFPTTLFFEPEADIDSLGCIKGIYSERKIILFPQHRFSRWLINTREKLQSAVPTLYNELIDAFIKADRVEASVAKVNRILDRLRRFSGNPFDITDALKIRTEDIIDEYH